MPLETLGEFGPVEGMQVVGIGIAAAGIDPAVGNAGDHPAIGLQDAAKLGQDGLPIGHMFDGFHRHHHIDAGIGDRAQGGGVANGKAQSAMGVIGIGIVDHRSIEIEAEEPSTARQGGYHRTAIAEAAGAIDHRIAGPDQLRGQSIAHDMGIGPAAAFAQHIHMQGTIPLQAFDRPASNCFSRNPLIKTDLAQHLIRKMPVIIDRHAPGMPPPAKLEQTAFQPTTLMTAGGNRQMADLAGVIKQLRQGDQQLGAGLGLDHQSVECAGHRGNIGQRQAARMQPPLHRFIRMPDAIGIAAGQEQIGQQLGITAAHLQQTAGAENIEQSGGERMRHEDDRA